MRSRLPSAIAVTLLATMLSALPATAADVQVPDLGRFSWTARVNGPFVGTVNAVQATPEVTIVYLSIGTTAENATGKASDFLGYGAGSTDDIAGKADSSLRLLRIIDRNAGKVYRPVQTSSHPECVCTSMNEIPRFDPSTQLLTFAAVLPKLPAGTAKVDIDVTGTGLVVTNVPVTRGAALAPSAGDGRAVVMGTSWPVVDTEAVAAVRDVRPFVTDLIAYQQDVDRVQRVERTPTSTRISVSADVLFAVDESTLSGAASTQLERVADQISATSGGGIITVTGYTDSDASDAYNLDLSLRRATTVVAALRRTIPGARFRAVGKGEADPVASNSSPQGKQLNRRVTISFAATGGA